MVFDDKDRDRTEHALNPRTRPFRRDGLFDYLIGAGKHRRRQS